MACHGLYLMSFSFSYVSAVLVAVFFLRAIIWLTLTRREIWLRPRIIIINMDPKAKKDFYILFITRSLRLFSYGSLAVVLFLYLNEIQFTESQIGVLMSLILLGDLIITMYLTTHADRFGRRRTLAIGALLKLFTGITFALSNNFYMLAISGIIGVISTTGGEIGPFLAI